ncbi:MAG: penicillin-binding protein activator LpoB [Opitutaceae bacterium]|jgi:uncharacterized protein (TIGR02722 family)|nr:penicillin-binding protein activator LpoB [Opitutaceae bacterium]
MKTHTTPILALAAAAGALLMSGCSTPAHYVDSKGPATLVSLNQINIQDFYQAADDLVAGILASGVLERAPAQPAVLLVSRIINNTQTNFDMSLLSEKVSGALLNTGKIVVLNDTDAKAESQRQMNEFLGKGAARPKPYYSLSGKIIEDKASAGRTKQTSYVFQLSLTLVDDGIQAWKGEKTITKQGTRSAIGW